LKGREEEDLSLPSFSREEEGKVEGPSACHRESGRRGVNEQTKRRMDSPHQRRKKEKERTESMRKGGRETGAFLGVQGQPAILDPKKREKKKPDFST